MKKLERPRTLEEWRTAVPNPKRRSKVRPFEPCYVYLGEVLSEQTARLGLTFRVVAERLGVDTSTVSRLSTGTMRLPVHEYPKLAAVLRVRVADLFPPGFLEEKR